LVQLLDAAAAADEIRADQDPYELMRAVASLCAGAGPKHPYDARRMTAILIAGLRSLASDGPGDPTVAHPV
jgi:hypothetical protein